MCQLHWMSLKYDHVDKCPCMIYLKEGAREGQQAEIKEVVELDHHRASKVNKQPTIKRTNWYISFHWGLKVYFPITMICGSYYYSC